MLQFITHRNDLFDEISGTRAVLEGGCRWVQLRMKEASEEEFLRTGAEVGRLCRACGATFLLDDRVELVHRLGADGVHLGKNDMPPREARALLGPQKIIGATANTFGDIERAAAQGADYIGLGPFRFTRTKEKLSPILGIEGYREILARCAERSIRLPVVAIGGITAADVDALMATGIAGIALSGALLNAENPAEETKKITNILKKYKP